MSETKDRPTPPAPTAKLGAAKLGGELKTRRQSLGWELADLAGSLRIRQTYLEAIEAGRMTELPGTTYALGFVRAYASALGLQGEAVAGRFRAESGEANIRPTLSFPAPVPQRGMPAGALMLLGLLILGGSYAGWYYVSEHQRTPPETVPSIPDRLRPAADKPTPSPQVASILPNASAPAPGPAAVTTPAVPTPLVPTQGVPTQAVPTQAVPPAGITQPAPLPVVQTPSDRKSATSAPAAPGVAVPPQAVPGASGVPAGTRIVLKANADAWVTIKQPGGAPAFNKLMHAGDTWPVPPGQPGLSLTTGNAGGTELDVDGTPIAGLGASGAVRRDLKLDPDALKAGPLPPIQHGRPKPAPAAPSTGPEG